MSFVSPLDLRRSQDQPARAENIPIEIDRESGGRRIGTQPYDDQFIIGPGAGEENGHMIGVPGYNLMISYPEAARNSGMEFTVSISCCCWAFVNSSQGKRQL